eukprot:g6690.t1
MKVHIDPSESRAAERTPKKGDRPLANAASHEAPPPEAPSPHPLLHGQSLSERQIAQRIGRKMQSGTLVSKHGKDLRRASTKKKVMEAMHYVAFLTLFTVVALWDRGVFGGMQQFQINRAIADHLFDTEFDADVAHVRKTFKDVGSLGELHDWLEGPLYETLYTRNSFDELPLNATALPQPLHPTVLGHAVVVGAVRVSQVRGLVSEPRNCHLPAAFKFVTAAGEALTPPEQWSCQDRSTPSDVAKEARAPFGGASGAAYTALSPGYLDEPAFWSHSTRWWYPTPKFCVLLPNPLAANSAGTGTNASAPAVAKAAIASLRANRYVDASTRAVFVDVAMHSPSLGVLSLVRAAVEVLPAGSVVPTYHVTTLNLWPYTTERPVARGYVRGALDIVVALWVLGYCVVEAISLRRHGVLVYVHTGGWARVTHVLNLAVALAWIGLTIAALAASPTTVRVHPPIGATDHLDLRSPARLWRWSRDILSLNMCLSWLKMLKYLTFVPKFSMLIGVLSHSLTYLIPFVCVGTIIQIGFAAAFTIAFGANVYDFSTVLLSIQTLGRFLLGDFDFHPLYEQHPVLGPVFFFCYFFLGIIFMLNMLIAIVNDAFTDTKAEIMQQHELHLVSVGHDISAYVRDVFARRWFCQKYCQRLLAWWGRQLGPDHAGDASACTSPSGAAGPVDRDGDGIVTQVELKQALAPALGSPQARSFAGAADADRSGVVEPDELPRALGGAATLQRRRQHEQEQHATIGALVQMQHQQMQELREMRALLRELQLQSA